MISILLIFGLLQPAPLYVVSPDFDNGGSIPVRCTCDGENVYPTLIVNGIPEGTKSLLIIAEDPDSSAESGAGWMAWNVPPVETILEETFVSADSDAERISAIAYQGPCPGDETPQRFSFKVFALDSFLALDKDREKSDVLEMLNGIVLAKGELTGVYRRSSTTSGK